MAPRASSSLPVAPPPPVPAVVELQAEEGELQYRCRFCGERYDNRYVFSAHYYSHTGLPDQVYLALAPKNSKVRRRILARLAGRHLEPKRSRRGRPPKANKAPPRPRARALSPDPIRVAFPPGVSPRVPFRPDGRARSPEPIRAIPLRAVPFPILGVRPQGQAQAGSSTGARAPAARAQGWGGVPLLKDYASWMTRFKSVGQVNRMRRDDRAGPTTSTAGWKQPVFDPPPGFAHVVPDLNFPVSTNIRSVVKKEIIIID